MKFRHWLAASYELCRHVRVALSYTLGQLQTLVRGMPRTEKQFELRVVLFEKRLDVPLQAFFSTVKRLEHADRWKIVRGSALLAALFQSKTRGGGQHHEAVDSR